MVTVWVLLIILLTENYIKQHSTFRACFQARTLECLKIYLAWLVGYWPEAKEDKVASSLTIVAFLTLPLIILGLVMLILSGILGTLGSVAMSALVLYGLLSDYSDSEESLLVMAHEKAYGLIFWFLLLGSYGAFIYWVLTKCEDVMEGNDLENTKLRVVFKSLHGLVAWVPARITAFVYGLVGNFYLCFKCWMAHMRDFHSRSQNVLTECGQAAIDATESGSGVALAQRTFVAWIVLGIISSIIFL